MNQLGNDPDHFRTLRQWAEHGLPLQHEHRGHLRRRLTAASTHLRVWMGEGTSQVDHARLPEWIVMLAAIAAAVPSVACAFGVGWLAITAVERLPELLVVIVFTGFFAAAMVVQFATWHVAYSGAVAVLAWITRPPAP